ncbi:MAG: hypothetical protein KDA84_03170, partial [Planctomycetaceae bacterium]|nr:hypothetical protein [Planctomycetaceae bacterium]
TDAEVADDWELFLSEVEAIQAEQMALLRSLAKSHGLKAIHMESVTMEGVEGFRRLVGHIRDYKPRGNRPLDLLLNEMHQHDTLLIGAPGRLMMTGEIEVLPVEDQKLYEAANPVKDSTVKFDEAAIAKREDAIVRNLLASDSPVAVLVMGGAHDLSDNLKRIGQEHVEYVRVELKAYHKANSLE